MSKVILIVAFVGLIIGSFSLHDASNKKEININEMFFIFPHFVSEAVTKIALFSLRTSCDLSQLFAMSTHFFQSKFTLFV